MRYYSSEASFAKHLCAHFTSHGYFVQRIESRLTGRGIPDLYVGTPTACYWIELKRLKVSEPSEFGIQIPWRPGQQRWMYQHYRLTNVPCFTFVAFNTYIACIPMTRMYKDSWVDKDNFLKVWYRVEDVRL